MGLEFKIAETEEEKKGCFEVRFLAYLHMGYVTEENHPDGIITDEFDQHSTIFMGRDCNKDEIYATIRVTHESDLGFQMEHLFAKEVKELRKRSEKLLETSKIMVLPDAGFKGAFGVINAIYLFAKKHGISDYCYMCSPEDAEMYAKIGIFPFAEPKMHPEIGNIAVPMHWNIENTTEKYKRYYERTRNVFV